MRSNGTAQYRWGTCPECGAEYTSASLFGKREADHDILCSRYLWEVTR